MTATPGIRVTVEDLATGEVETKTIWDDYLLVCAGRKYLATTQSYPRSGTSVLTVKDHGPAGADR